MVTAGPGGGPDRMTVDPQGNPVGRLQVIEDVRDEKGTRLPDDADGGQGTG
ncbi:hypothetical protein GCM10018965_043500 [Nonomuraea roseola]